MEWIGDLERAFAASIYPNRGPILVGVVIGLGLTLLLARHRGWHRAIGRHPARTAAILVPVLAIALPLGWYLASPLVISTTIDEPAPIVAAGPSATPTPPSPTPAATSVPTLAPSPTPSATPAPTPVKRAGTFAGADEFHFGRGTATLIETAPGTFVVRLEDFAVRNGPDLYVYLSPSGDGYADGVVELGRLKADTGNQNYDVPAGLDPGEFDSVVIWCKQFSVQFAFATLES